MPTAAEILIKAKEKVERGWLQHRNYSPITGQVCAGWAIDSTVMELVGNHHDNTEAALAQRAAWSTLSTAVTELFPDLDGITVVGWNDMPGRQKTEVLDTFDHAIKLAQRDSPAPVATRAG